MPTVYISHNSCEKHIAGEEHPEAPERIGAIQNRLIAGQMADFLRWIDAEPATREQLVATHDPDYVDAIFARAPQQDRVELDSDTFMMPHTLAAALHAAGSVIQAVDFVMAEQFNNAFCAVRPPGHHAEYDRAMGFCIFNNVAVGARHAINHHGLDRVAIVDFDVHHGNGTEHIFRQEPKVLYASSYQHPYYPFSDPGKSHDNMVHMPLSAGSGSAEFRQAIGKHLLPALDAFQPQLLMVSAGFDAHKQDPLAQLRLQDADYAWITDELMQVADRHCGGKLVSVLEGGYDLDALGRAAFAHIRCLMGLG
ncbi:histone deacetylase family protein [Halioxenophilus aromaticivorans]|uniref:Histone deacetylase family protein n=1 Tax=Halioxenophilus aromaticivorans TaxID=1306992 RepID=A0AAV3TZ67_9ALTE